VCVSSYIIAKYVKPLEPFLVKSSKTKPINQMTICRNGSKFLFPTRTQKNPFPQNHRIYRFNRHMICRKSDLKLSEKPAAGFPGNGFEASRSHLSPQAFLHFRSLVSPDSSQCRGRLKIFTDSLEISNLL